VKENDENQRETVRTSRVTESDISREDFDKGKKESARKKLKVPRILPSMWNAVKREY